MRRDTIVDLIFGKLEKYNEKKCIAERMIKEGISEDMMCKLLDMNKSELKKCFRNNQTLKNL